MPVLSGGSPAFIAKREVYMTCKGSKGCGLWMTWSSPCWVRKALSPPPCACVPCFAEGEYTGTLVWGQARRQSPGLTREVHSLCPLQTTTCPIVGRGSERV